MAERPEPVHAGVMPTKVGKYKILRQIAQGGMAEIYLATAVGIEGFEKLCVLKRILPILSANHEFVEMFLDEARIAGSLLHSNIAQVFDIGSDAGNYYFVMEFLRGEDVRHILMKSVERREAIPYEHIVSIITGVCSGLHYAHEMRGRDGKQLSIVHRDISPQNVFVTHDGNVKLCDFGIAKSATQLTETRVGTLKGKIRYMAPEQCQAEPLDRRSDVFALSIVLWELITQRRLYRGKSDFEIFKAIVEEDAPPPSNYRRDVDPGLEAVVMNGLRRKREERYQTAQELQIALEDWARSERVPASPVRLAGYMRELFGPPPQLESILEQVSEADPLAKRIRQLNAPDDSGGSPSALVSRVRDSQRNLAVPMDSERDLETSVRMADSNLTPSLASKSSTRSVWLVLVALMLLGGALAYAFGRATPPRMVTTKPTQPIASPSMPSDSPTPPTPPLDPVVTQPAPHDETTNADPPVTKPAHLVSTSPKNSSKPKPKHVPATSHKDPFDEMLPP